MKLLSVIIVTYNSQNIIEKCLSNLFLYNDIKDDLEVIIVDNSRAEISIKMFEMLEEKFPKKLKLIKNEKNGGYGQGNNLGIQQSSASLIAIMNPDIILAESLFNKVLIHFETEKNLGMLGFKQYGGFNLSFYFRLEFHFPFVISGLTKFCNYFSLFSTKFMFLSGAFLIIDKQKFQEIGCFDENIFLYVEESDITNRFLARNIKIIYDKSKFYMHEIDGRSEMSNSGYKIFIDSAVYYLRKFSYNDTLFFKYLDCELRFKRVVYSILGKKQLSLMIKEQIKIIKSHTD